MKPQSRRGFLAAAGSATLLAACARQTQYSEKNSVASDIDIRADETLDFLYRKYPQTIRVGEASVAQLVIPLVTKAGFMVGGSYGRGALRRDGRTLGYFSATSGSLGWQVGAQQQSHVLFFMNEAALSEFLLSDGWTADAEADFAIAEAGGSVSGAQINNTDVISYVFGQAGLQLGAAMKGTKYTRITP